MAVFDYRALNEQTAAVEGTIAADTARAARDALRLRGLIVESLKTTGAGNASMRLPLRGRQRYGAKRVAMVRELSTLLAAGIPLLEAIDSLVLQQTGGFKQSMMILRDRISAGGSLADAMREQPTVFDPLSIHMVEVGESSGTLDVVLDQLANFSERYLQLKDRVTNALFYPIVVFSLSCGVGLFLMTVVVPMLLDNLLEAGKPIPLPTRILKTMSDFVRGHGLSIIGVSVLSVIAIIAALRTTTGKRLWHRTILQLPLLGGMARKQEIARMALIVGTLLKSGVVLVESLAIAARAMKNVVLRDSLSSAQSAIQSGSEIGEALDSTGQFPPTVIQIFTVGQQSGTLEEMLQRLADNYDRQVTTLSLRLATLMEPVLIIGLAVFVGFILFATVLPILEAGNVL
jgi:type II secretory pathway component PulF